MQAFDTATRSPDTGRWSWSDMGRRNQRVTARTVGDMNFIDGIEPEKFLHLIDSALCFENAHGVHFGAAHEPIQSWHWGVVIEQWCIHENHGFSGGGTNDDTKLALGNTSDEAGDVGQILVGGRGARKQHRLFDEQPDDHGRDDRNHGQCTLDDHAAADRQEVECFGFRCIDLADARVCGNCSCFSRSIL